MMMPFSIGLGWSVLTSLGWTWTTAGLVCGLWIVGPEIGLLLGLSAGFECDTPLQKARKKVGQRGFRPWPLRCLSQFLAERKDRLLRGRMFLRTFH